MNSLKARLLSFKKRVCPRLRKKRTKIGRRAAAIRGRVASTVKTIHRLRLRLRRRRLQRPTRLEAVISKPSGEEQQGTSSFPAKAVPSRELTFPISFSETETKISRDVPTLIVFPPCTPTSMCSTLTPPRSPSLTSWDSWTTVSSDEEHEPSVCTDSDSCLNDSLYSPDDGDDDDDDDEEEEEEEGIGAVGPCVASECISHTVCQDVSFGIIADFSNDCPTPSGAPADSSTDECVPLTELLQLSPSQYFANPPFTAEQERMIVETNHPYKEYVLQMWDIMLQHCAQQSCPQESTTLSRTFSEEELRSIFGSEDTDEETEELDEVFEPQTPTCPPPPITEPAIQNAHESFQTLSHHQNYQQHCQIPERTRTLAETDCSPAIAAPQQQTLSQTVSVGSQSQDTVPKSSKPPPLTLAPQSSTGIKPAQLTLSGGEDNTTTTPPPPPGPSTAEAEHMWKEYTANRSTIPEYFLFPLFTPEQEEWIVQIDHPFKDYVLQTWQNNIHSSMVGWLEDLVN